MNLGYFLGVDAGNSKTVALVSDAAGRILGWGRGGGGDIYASEAAALASVTGAVEGALEQASLLPAELAAGCFSLVGADWPEDFTFWEAEVEARGYGKNVLVVNDALGALRAGTPDNGVAVVCGTGAAIGARRGVHVWHSSFWQEPVGGAELSERTLRAVYRAELGLGPETVLSGAVLNFFGCSSIRNVLHHLTARKAEPVQRPGLSRLLLGAAGAGDAVALGIIRQAGTTLGEYACVAARHVELEQTFPLVLAGGVLRHPGTALRDAVNARVLQEFPDAQPGLAPFEPVVGALLLALETHAPVTDYAPLTGTLPPLDFFTT